MQPVFMRKQSSKLQLYMKQNLLNFYLQAKQKYKENDSFSLMIYSTDTVIYRSRRNKYKVKLPCNKSTWTLAMKVNIFLQRMRYVVSIPQDILQNIDNSAHPLRNCNDNEVEKSNMLCLLHAQLDYKIQIWELNQLHYLHFQAVHKEWVE